MAAPKNIDWEKAKRRYITGTMTQTDLAKELGVNRNTLRKKASAEKWEEEREQYASNVHQKCIKKTAELQATTEAIVNANLDESERNLSILIAKQLLKELTEPEERAGQKASIIKSLTESVLRLREAFPRPKSDEQNEIRITFGGIEEGAGDGWSK